MKRLLFLFAFLLSSTLYLYSEEEWEYMNISSWKWSANSSLKYYGNSPTKLNVLNDIAETDEDFKNNKCHYETTWMYCQSIGNRACTITLNAKNERNPRTHKFMTYKPDGTMVWYSDKSSKRGGQHLYWGLRVEVENTYGGTSSYSIDYINQYFKSSSYPYSCTSSCNSDSQKWEGILDRETRQFRIVYDGVSTINFFGNDGNDLLKTFTNVKGIYRIGLDVGTASDIIVSDFKVLR